MGDRRTTNLGIRPLQEWHQQWINHNFPSDGHDSWEGLSGVTEEVGELLTAIPLVVTVMNLHHIHLKGKWGIRGQEGDANRAAKVDAVGDIFIYLMSYCNRNGIDLEQAIVDTWTRVSQRDWVADPQGGGE